MGKEPAKREIKQERAARTRVEILEAAITLFARRGFLATTMAELAKAIRMTPGALYWHFPTKEDLLLAAIDELHQRYLNEFVDLLSEHRTLPAREQLISFINRTRSSCATTASTASSSAWWPPSPPSPTSAWRTPSARSSTVYVHVLAGIIRYGQKKQEFRTDMDPMHTAHGMMGGVHGPAAAPEPVPRHADV